jgi:hypothetical protein
LRVIDLAQVRSGPTCVKQFADFGADVIRIEPPAHSGRTELMTGARDGADMLNLHRNKRLITLDLKAPGAKEVLHRLVRSADVDGRELPPRCEGSVWASITTASQRSTRASSSPASRASGRKGRTR